jgi:hypothetical protein
MGNGRIAVRVLAATTFLISLVGTAEARGIGAHLEGGFGSTTVRPLERESAPGGTACAGVSIPLAGRVRGAIDFAATAGGDPAGQGFIPEASRPGNRTITSCLLGVEVTRRYDGLGLFALIGVGVGHSTLESARGVFAPPYAENWFIPSRSLTAFAFGAGAGYRFGGGPGPLQLQLAVRAHAVADAGEIPAYAYALTVGLAY